MVIFTPPDFKTATTTKMYELQETVLEASLNEMLDRRCTHLESLFLTSKVQSKFSHHGNIRYFIDKQPLLKSSIYGNFKTVFLLFYFIAPKICANFKCLNQLRRVGSSRHSVLDCPCIELKNKELFKIRPKFCVNFF